MINSTRMVAMAPRVHHFALILATALVVTAGAATSGPQSLFGNNVFAKSDTALIDAARPSAALLPSAEPASLDTSAGASLFSGRNAGSLFAFRPKDVAPAISALTHFGVKGLRQLIASAEAGRADYDAVQHGARIKPPKPPTRMTIREIFAWIDATPGQPHAIGRYQMIPSTLRRVVNQLGLSHDLLYSPEVQDLCADVLLEDAGLSAFLNGNLGQTGFMNNLAKIWAGLPNASGRSHYHGYAGNRAVMTWTKFQTSMEQIFPSS